MLESRRAVIKLASLGIAGVAASRTFAAGRRIGGPAGAGLLDDLEQRTFRWFWDVGDPATGLVPDRWPSTSFCSIAAVGFALNAYATGAERGWISRAKARER